MEAQLSSLVNVASNYLVSGQDNSKRLGTAHPSIVPYQAFRCMDGKFISVAVGNDRQFRDFCNALGNESWSIDERFSSNAGRVKNRDILIKMIDGILMTKKLDYWLEKFEGRLFPCGPVRSIAESFTCPQAQARSMIEEVEHPTCGQVKLVGIPVKYSRTQCSINSPPPLLGEHTEVIMKEILGYEDDEIDNLAKVGAIRILDRSHCN